MYLTVPPNEVYAVDTATGAELWRYRRDLPPQGGRLLRAGEPRVGGSRGPAFHGDSRFLPHQPRPQDGARAVGSRRCSTTKRATARLWPRLVVKDKVMVGTTGGEYGVRGFIDAYNVEDGKREWRFHTVAGPGEFGRDTWEGDSWKTRRRLDLGHAVVRPRTESYLLGRRQSQGRTGTAICERVTTCSSDSVVGARPRHRRAQMAFPVHAPRCPRLGRHAGHDPGRPRI